MAFWALRANRPQEPLVIINVLYYGVLRINIRLQKSCLTVAIQIFALLML